MSKWIIPALLLALTLQIATASAAEPARELMKIDVVTAEQMQLLARGHYHVDRVYGDAVELWLHDAELRKLEEQGLRPYRIPNPAYEMFQHLEATARADGSWRDYHNYTQLTTELQNFEALYPDITQLFSTGQSVQGRELWVLQISDNPTVEEDEPEFKYISTMHGNEPVGTELLLELCDLILSGYGVDPRFTNIVDNIDLYILPMMNPDGNTSGSRYNANGVDLNRNFPDQHSDPVNTPAGREAETAAVMNWTFDHNFDLSANFHTGALVVNYPYDSNPEGTNTYTACPDDALFIVMSEAYSIHNIPMWNGSFYHGITNGADWYCIYGGMQDWNYVWEGGMEVCIELSNASWPPADQLPGLWNDNRESMLSYLEYCLKGIRGIVTDADTGLPLAATVELQGIDYQTYSDAVVGDYHRLCLPGTYTLVVSKQFYETATISGIMVGSGDATVVDVALTPIAPNPDLQLVGTLIDDGGDGVLDPGETAWLTLELYNAGNQPASGTIGTLATTSPQVTLLDAAGNWGTINPDANVWNSGDPFQLQVDAGCPVGEALPFTLALTAGDYSTELDFALTVGLQIEDFESGDFTQYDWEMSGYAPWIITGSPYEGVFCAQSGDIGNNQTTSLSLTAEVAAPGNISFQYKVSSEATYDFLRFYIDGAQQASWSGEAGWTEFSTAITSGVHTLTWTYYKDGSQSDGSDCGWIDYIVFPPLAPPTYPEIDVTPVAFNVNLAPDSSTTEPLTLDNSGDAELMYSILLATDGRATSVPHLERLQVTRGGETTRASYLELGKGEVDPRPGQAARDQGGPDGYGYLWIDSDEPGGPAFDWVEINSVGTSPGGDDDASYGPFNLGFDFNFYGVDYDAVRICTNGFLSFTSTDDAYGNQGIPNSAEPNTMIAPFWDDLTPPNGGTIYYYADTANNRFIVEWDGVDHYNPTGNPETFQVILNADGTILCQYQTVSLNTSCTVGIENQDGGDGLQVVFNATYLHSGLALLFTTSLADPWLSIDETSGTVPPSGSDMRTVTFDATDLTAGTYTGSITINSNDQDESSIVVPVTLEVGSVTPDPVDDLTISVSGSNLTLIWSAAPGATHYLIYDAAEPYDTFSYVATTTGTSWSTTVSGEKRFYYVVAGN